MHPSQKKPHVPGILIEKSQGPGNPWLPPSAWLTHCEAAPPPHSLMGLKRHGTRALFQKLPADSSFPPRRAMSLLSSFCSPNRTRHFKESIQFIHECRLKGEGCLVHWYVVCLLLRTLRACPGWLDFSFVISLPSTFFFSQI